MIKELGTMALVAVTTTSISNHFDTVMVAARDISSVYAAASNNTNPDVFLNSVKAQEKRLNDLSNKVASLDIKKELGPFGVMVPTAK